MALEDFQLEHGAEWSKIINTHCFSAAMIFRSLEAVAYIKNLSDEKIKEDSLIILTDMRARARYEAELYSMAVIPEVAPADVSEEPVDQIEENFELHSRTLPPPPTGRRKPKKRK